MRFDHLVGLRIFRSFFDFLHRSVEFHSVKLGLAREVVEVALEYRIEPPVNLS